MFKVNTLLILSKIREPVRGYAFKSDLKIKWVRPEKISCIDPRKSGDLESLPPVDMKQFPLEFRNSEELKTADDLVKRMFTLEFMPRRHTMQVVKHDMMGRVKEHQLDHGSSMESEIASMTAGIRNLQKRMEEFPRNKRLKVVLKELIDHRKKYLKYLRARDYKRFEWLLEKLNIIYKSPPSKFIRVERKASLRKLTNKHCDDIRQQRLTEYREILEAQKVDFLKEKFEKLKWMRKEEEECGVEPTVTQEDIDAVLQKLKELELSKETKQNISAK